MEKQVVFTVDVEGHVGKDPVTSLIYGKTKDGMLCGIDLIMDMLDKYEITGLFFVDIAEAWDYGEDKIAEVLRHIQERGHNVGVHIHPDHMADKNRLLLAEYSYEEQYDIIKKCTNFYEKTLGMKPIAFRAGKYGANWDTLNILAKLGYIIDFSQFYGQKWCKLNPPVTYLRTTKLDNGIIEVPVTSFKSFRFASYSRFDKIDVGQTYGEFKRVMDNLKEDKNCNVIVLFAHSFSLVKWRRTPNCPVFSRSKYLRMKKQLDYIKNNKFYKVTNLMRIVCEQSNRKRIEIDDKDVVSMRGIRTLVPFFDRALGVVKSRYDIRFRKQ